MNVKGWTSSANWAILRNQFTGNGETSGEVSEWLKDLVSKTSSGFILLVGSNPTLSVNNRAVVALIRSSTARLFTERVALGARELDAMCTRVAGARQSQQPQRGTFVVCTFVVPALRLRIADFQRGMWRAMAFEVDRWKFESSRVGWLGWRLRLTWSWVGGALDAECTFVASARSRIIVRASASFDASRAVTASAATDCLLSNLVHSVWCHALQELGAHDHPHLFGLFEAQRDAPAPGDLAPLSWTNSVHR